MEGISKAQRHGRILALIARHQVHTQQQLADLLKQEGVEVTQVTLSRDIHDLGLIKTGRGYSTGKGETKGPTFWTLAPDLLLEARAAQNIVVVKTHAGHAMSLCRALDQAGFPEVVGTVAGDDTILVVTESAQQARALAPRLRGVE